RQYYDPPTLIGNSWFIKEIVFVLLGFVALLICTLAQPSILRACAYPIYGASIVLLLAVAALGHGVSQFGATRWIEFAGMQVQPSEPAKLALALALARVLSGPRVGPKALLISVGLTAVPVVLI